MTENTPAPAEQALPSRRARRAARNAEGPAAAADGVRPQTGKLEAEEAHPAQSQESAVLETRTLEAGTAAAGDSAAAGGGQPLTRRRARAELRSWATAPETGEGVPGVAPGRPPVLLPEQEAGVPAEREATSAGEPDAAAGAELEPAEGSSVPDAAEAGTAVVDAVHPAAPLEREPEDEAGQRRAVVLPELPASPPGSPAQDDEDTAADDAAPNGDATDIETAQPAQDSGSQDEPQASHPSGLPLEPALMPSGLRERTRIAVRGEPNDVRRATFLDTQTAKIPAARGFRGFLASLGIRIAPSSRELEERQDTRTVSQHWPGPRTISVVNGKGGANKTPTTVMLAAIFARNGGGPVLAWDNNETRGTLGWRTEQARHDATVMDLLPETGLLLSPAAQSAMLARFVHHQTDDKYDVLRSNPNVLASEQKVTKADFDALHSVASKYFRLNIVDSGNDESAERWLRMIDHTDQLVIATTTVEEHAEAGALLLEALQERGGRYAELARGAVVVVSQADRNGTEAQARKVAEAFKVLARAAVTIPYDPALVKGQIRYASLRPATQRAWLKAAAAVAEGL
ncbi:MAG: AAA family ATPase [Arthrobacter sp.]